MDPGRTGRKEKAMGEMAVTVQRIGSPVLAVIIPSIVFIISIIATALLYRHFSKQ
jgi:hypothetical protein